MSVVGSRTFDQSFLTHRKPWPKMVIQNVIRFGQFCEKIHGQLKIQLWKHHNLKLLRSSRERLYDSLSYTKQFKEMTLIQCCLGKSRKKAEHSQKEVDRMTFRSLIRLLFHRVEGDSGRVGKKIEYSEKEVEPMTFRLLVRMLYHWVNGDSGKVGTNPLTPDKESNRWTSDY